MSNYYNTILIVDDNPAILTALKICLAGVFTRIVTLSSTDRLVATMSEEQVDVVLLDMNFSLGVNTGQDGLFWLRTLKKLPRHAGGTDDGVCRRAVGGKGTEERGCRLRDEAVG